MPMFTTDPWIYIIKKKFIPPPNPREAISTADSPSNLATPSPILVVHATLRPFWRFHPPTRFLPCCWSWLWARRIGGFYILPIHCIPLGSIPSWPWRYQRNPCWPFIFIRTITYWNSACFSYSWWLTGMNWAHLIFLHLTHSQCIPCALDK